MLEIKTEMLFVDLELVYLKIFSSCFQEVGGVSRERSIFPMSAVGDGTQDLEHTRQRLYL